MADVLAPEPGPAAVVSRFNEHINRRDLDGLGDLMTEDHAFIDTEGAAVSGRTACPGAWQGFFAGFPDYRNTFESVVVDGRVVTVAGRSDCSDPVLAGPALWQAVVVDGRVAQWRVYEDTRDNRRVLGLTAPG